MKIEIETLNLSELQDCGYVLIRIDIGKKPPAVAKKYLESMKSSLKICEILDNYRIPYDVVGCMDILTD